MATYIDLNTLPRGAVEEIIKTRIVREFADSSNAEQRGEVPALSADDLRPFYKQAIGNTPSGGGRGAAKGQKDLTTLGRRLLDSDMERTNDFQRSGFAEEILDGLGRKG